MFILLEGKKVLSKTKKREQKYHSGKTKKKANEIIEDMQSQIANNLNEKPNNKIEQLGNIDQDDSNQKVA